MKSFLSSLVELAKVIIIALAIVAPIRAFVFQPFLVRGSSMEPNFHSGEYLIIDELSYRFREPVRGEVVVFRFPQNTSQRYIKRIIGLPGEAISIKEGKISIARGDQTFFLEEPYLADSLRTKGDVELELGENEYFVLGDNRLFSADSRVWGTLQRRYLIGRAWIRLLPLSVLAKMQPPAYESPSNGK